MVSAVSGAHTKQPLTPLQPALLQPLTPHQPQLLTSLQFRLASDLATAAASDSAPVHVVIATQSVPVPEGVDTTSPALSLFCVSPSPMCSFSGPVPRRDSTENISSAAAASPVLVPVLRGDSMEDVYSAATASLPGPGQGHVKNNVAVPLVPASVSVFRQGRITGDAATATLAPGYNPRRGCVKDVTVAIPLVSVPDSRRGCVKDDADVSSAVAASLVPVPGRGRVKDAAASVPLVPIQDPGWAVLGMTRLPLLCFLFLLHSRVAPPLLSPLQFLLPNASRLPAHGSPGHLPVASGLPTWGSP